MDDGRGARRGARPSEHLHRRQDHDVGLRLGDDGLSEGEISKLAGIGQHISMTERRAMTAERETADRLLAAYLALCLIAVPLIAMLLLGVIVRVVVRL